MRFLEVNAEISERHHMNSFVGVFRLVKSHFLGIITDQVETSAAESCGKSDQTPERVR